MKKGYKHYGLTGQNIRIRMVHPSVADLDAAIGCVNPWAYGEQVVKVIHESEYCLTVRFPEHYNPRGWGLSKPYNTSIHKHDLRTGEVIMKTMSGKRIA
ncbi:MAG: hypothetical protein LIO94_07895 [Clostridiales bacterium]|nr:hypothetical protein [Clostridiales bacterium]